MFRYLKKLFQKEGEKKTLEMSETKDNDKSVKPANKEPDVVQLPSQQEFFVNTSLYKTYTSLDLTNPAHVLHIRKFEGDPYKLDLYCVECGQDSVFTSNERMFGWGNQKVWGTQGVLSEHAKQNYVEENFASITANRVFQVEFLCSRNAGHITAFIFKLHNGSLIKIGQFPSVADIQLPKIKKYRKILGDKYEELAKAVGLFAHGVGVGSFVYLRRILENLVEQAHLQAKTKAGWDDTTYEQKRFVEKIEMLQGYLPDFLLDNCNVYGVLSKGIHELSEEDCLKIFPLMQISIELILDEKIAEIEKQRKIAETRKKLNNVAAELKK